MSFGFGFALPAYPLRGGGGNNPFNQDGATLDLSFTGTAGDLSGADTYTLNTDFTTPEYQVAAQYAVWENGVGLVQKTFAQIVTFTRTGSTATYFNSAGVLTTTVADEPRFDYNPSTLAARGLLIEEARTNLLTYSALIGGTNWTNQNSIVVTTNTTDVTDPSNTNTASKLVSGSATSQTLQSATLTAAVHSASVFLRTLSGTVSVELYVYLTASPFTVIGTATVTATSTWQRFSFTTSTATATSYTLAVRVPSGTAYAFGAQLEAGAFPTSYIPTTTTALTRNPDQASVNTLAPWFNSAAGTLFAEFTRGYTGNFSNFASPAAITDNLIPPNTNAIASAYTNGASQQLYNSMVVNSVEQLTFQQETAQTTNKVALAYKTDDTQQFTNGVAEIADTSCTVPTSVSQMNIGSAYVNNTFMNSWIRRVTYYPRRLAQADGIAITT